MAAFLIVSRIDKNTIGMKKLAIRLLALLSFGVILACCDDRDDDHLLPQQLPQAVTEFIAQQYPGARIIGGERERNPLYVLEVDIYDGSVLREVRFDAANQWVQTKTEILLSEVPSAVLDALRASQYGTWRIDEVDHYASPAREWYRFELDEPASDRELEIDILPDGTLL